MTFLEQELLLGFEIPEPPSPVVGAAGQVLAHGMELDVVGGVLVTSQSDTLLHFE